MRAYDLHKNQVRAIKIVDVSQDCEGENIQRLIGYHHPRVVDYIAHQRIEGKSWIVMQYLDGDLLGNYEKKYGYIRHTAAYREQEKESLSYLHRRGVVVYDRENDAENVMVMPSEQGFQIVMFDFGTLARR